MSSPPNRMFFLSSRQPAWAGAPGMHEACPRPRGGGGTGSPHPWPAQIRLGRAGPSSSSPAPPYPHSSCLAFKGHTLSQPYLVASLDIPQLLDSQMLPLPRNLPQAALSFPANRAEGKAVLNQGVWSFHPDQSNTNVKKKLDKELSNLKLVD